MVTNTNIIVSALQVKDRSSWRTAIEDGKYDPQVDVMVWGGKLETKTRIKSEAAENVDEEECSRSEISSSLDGDGLVNSTTAKKNVADITCSILQLAQSIESKYLKKPLGIARSFFIRVMYFLRFGYTIFSFYFLLRGG